MPVIESRYAEAFLGLVKPEDADRAEDDLTGLSEIWRTNAELKFFMQNPVVPAAAKKEAVQKIFDGNQNPVFLNFINLLIDKNRLDLLPEISREYTELKNRYRNRIGITVYSAEPLEERQLSLIGEKYRAMYGSSSAETENIVDPSLIGGLMIKIGDTLIDDTLSGRLKNLLSAIER